MSGRFLPAGVSGYMAWLSGHLAAGGSITHVYDYPFSRTGMLIALADFTTGGECGARAASIIVPGGVSHSGKLGHCQLYYMDGFRMAGMIVPAYSDAVFAALPDYARAAEAERAARDAMRKPEPGCRSDLSDYYRSIS